jgi:hypothetical protein
VAGAACGTATPTGEEVAGYSGATMPARSHFTERSQASVLAGFAARGRVRIRAVIGFAA